MTSMIRDTHLRFINRIYILIDNFVVKQCLTTKYTDVLTKKKNIYTKIVFNI